MITRDFLKSVELFSTLSPADAEALANMAREEILLKGETLFRERDPGGMLYLVISGTIEISKSSPGGTSTTVGFPIGAASRSAWPRVLVSQTTSDFEAWGSRSRTNAPNASAWPWPIAMS